MKLRSRGVRGVSQLKKRRLIIKLSLISAGLLVVLGVLVFLIFSDTFRIKESVVQGANVLSSEELKRFSENKLDQKYLWFVPKRNTFIYPKRDIEESLKNRYVDIDEVALYKESLDTLIINIKERRPKYFGCKNEEGSVKECFYVDKNGFIFRKAPSFSDNVFIELENEVFFEDKPIGKNILSEESFQEFVNISETLTANNIKITKADLSEVDVTIETSEGWDVHIENKDSIDKVIRNLSATINSEVFTNEETRRMLEYIDLRFGNKVFYKMKEEEWIGSEEL